MYRFFSIRPGGSRGRLRPRPREQAAVALDLADLAPTPSTSTSPREPRTPPPRTSPSPSLRAVACLRREEEGSLLFPVAVFEQSGTVESGLSETASVECSVWIRGGICSALGGRFRRFRAESFDLEVEFSPFRGGESEALRRLKESLASKEWVANFEKPKGDPSAFIKPATTVLSPYLKFGCLSSRYFYQNIQEIYKNAKRHTSPPVSLVGQLLWRDFFYTVAFGTPNFDQMRENKICKQIPWSNDDKLLASWREGQTGFPWIDAIMVQLKKWGWMHHLARHSVACFLTRGDLYIHWEKGRDVFERLLIDSDWAINNGNWLWLSCSSFFYQYHRIYSPTTFGKKYDPAGKFIQHFLPVLKDMPKEYIYEPWTAPLSVQKKANCIIGKDYPRPIVSHDTASKECRKKMGDAYALNNSSKNLLGGEDGKRLREKSEEDKLYPNRRPRLKQKRLS